MSQYVSTLQQGDQRRRSAEGSSVGSPLGDDQVIRIVLPLHGDEADYEDKAATRHSVIMQTLAISRNTFPRLLFGRQLHGATPYRRNLPSVASSLVVGVATMIGTLLRQKNHS